MADWSSMPPRSMFLAIFARGIFVQIFSSISLSLGLSSSPVVLCAKQTIDTNQLCLFIPRRAPGPTQPLQEESGNYADTDHQCNTDPRTRSDAHCFEHGRKPKDLRQRTSRDIPFFLHCELTRMDRGSPKFVGQR